MRLEEALTDCLTRLDDGEAIETVLSRYPGQAAELREQISVARGLQALSRTLPVRAGGEGRARMRMQTALREARQAGGHRAPGVAILAPFRSLGRLAVPALAVSAIAVIALLLTTVAGTDVSQPIRSIVGSSSAEAATLDGVVVDNADGVLTVETANGIEKVSVTANTPIADSAGARAALADVVAGEVVTIKGTRLGNGAVAASRIDRKTLAALKDWCDLKNDQCQLLKDHLETLVSQCQAQKKAGCAALGAGLTELRQKLQAAATQLRELQDRCRAGGQLACRDLQRFCNQHKNLCPPQNQRPIPAPNRAPQS